MRIMTIGFTKTSAERFFGLLGDAGARRLVDVRLNNVSQLSGFAKRADLAYFLRAILGVEYRHELLLAPTQEMLDEYRKHGLPWAQYEQRYRSLIDARAVGDRLDRADYADAVLLCSEHEPHRCHRRVAAEHLAERWGDVEVEHLF